MLTTSFQSKDFFFDVAAVQDAVREAGQDPERLGQAGMVIRGKARTSMRQVAKKKTISAPGTPPRAHKAEPNLRTILYAWDPVLRKMVVGPVLLAGARVRGETVPAVHEHGGLIQLPLLKIAKPPRKHSGRKPTRKQLAALKRKAQEHALLSAVSRGRRTIVWRAVRYPARPFMQPALEAAIPRLAELWKGSVNEHLAAGMAGSPMVRARAT